MGGETGREPQPMTPAEALRVVSDAPRGLLALGMPGCAACLLLPASLAEVGRGRPDLAIAIGEFATPEDWACRERLMWPRGIHVSRSSVPAMALLIDGEVVATRPGGGPASVIEPWLADRLGPPSHPPPDGLTPREAAAPEGLSGFIASHRPAKGRREASLGIG